MERKNILIGIALACSLVLVLIFGPTIGFYTLPVEDYGDIALYNDNAPGDPMMDATSVLNVQDGDYMIAWLKDDVDTTRKPTDLDWTVSLRLEDGSAEGQWIADATDRRTYPDSSDNIRWNLALDQCLEGTNTYFVFFYATVGDTEVDAGGNSHTFQVVNAIEPVYLDAEFTEFPEDANYTVDEVSAYATWHFSYDGAYTAVVKVDGAEDYNRHFDAGSGDDLVMYTIDTSVPGTYTVVLTVTPDSTENSQISDTVIVDIVAPTTTTTDTDTTTTTTTTTGTTTDDETPVDYSIPVLAVGAAMLILIVIAWRRK